MKKIIVLILLVIACSAPAKAQQRLKDLRNKTSGQISNSANGTFMDSTFFKSRIGVLGRSLTEAVQEHGLTPYDFATLQLAKDTSTVRRFPLIVPWNYTASALTFRDADSAAVIYNYGTINITANDTIPAGAYIVMMRSGRLNISAGVTLRINGNFDAPRRRKFYGGGAVTFGNAAVEEIYPEWFGAANDSLTTISDSGPAFKAALDAAANGSIVSLANDGRSLSSPKGYVINTTVRIPSDRAITLKGNGAVIYSSASDTVFFFQNGSQTSVPSYAISPTRDQPRHHVDGIRFKRTAATKASGVAIAAINTTGMTISNCDFYDYRNNIVFNNQSDGWCENNDVFNCRIAGQDTAISYKVTLGGNNSFATNTLRRVTITAFDSVNARYGVGVYTSANANLYRNVWDQLLVFPRDSVRSFYLNGKAEDLVGNAHIEYIGAKERNQMFGFHFGPNASEMRFNLHVNITGRRYFNPEKLFYSQIAGSFGFTGITTTLDGTQNHGIEMAVDSTKFTTLVSIVRAHLLGMTTPGDSARIFYAQANNSAEGGLDLRANRRRPIEIRSLTDNVFSSATANTVGGSALPFHPVRALIVGSNRTMSNAGVATDTSRVDIRTTSFLLFGSGTSTVDSLVAFKGGVITQELEVQFSDDSTIIVNLSGGTGTGRIFLKENKNLRSVPGLRMAFRCEAESGGFFWREKWRQFPEQVNSITDNDPTPAVATLRMLRIANSAGTTITDFLENSGSISGRSERVITLVFLNGNTTVSNNANIVLAGGTSFTAAANDVLQLQYDETASAWREVSRTGSAAAPVIGTVDSTNIVNLGVAAVDLSNSSVLNAKIANGAITVNKFATSVYPAIRGKIGWTSDGTITQDTLTTRAEWGGRANTSFKIFDADGDTITLLPQQNNSILLKDGSTTLASIDSLGRVNSGGSAGGNGTISLDGSGAQPALKLQASDGDLTQVASTTSDEMAFTGASGDYTFDNWLRKPDMIEFLGGALKETAAAGASDTTQNYIPVKALSVGDTATFDFSTSKRFASIDSIVVIAYANTPTSNVVLNMQIRQIQIGGTIAGAFNAASSKTIATGTATTLRQWSFTSFGSVTASVYSDIVGKIYRTAGGTGGDVFVRRVLIYGGGLR